MSTAPTITEMSAAELKDLIQNPPAETPAPPTETPAVAAPPTETVEEFTATIDIGDGAGVQVFSAPTKDELLEKLIEAQTNATRKIRELSNKQVPPPAPASAPPQPPALEYNPEEEARLNQLFVTDPVAAHRELMKREFGLTPAEIKQRLEQAKAAEEARVADEAAVAFVQSTPDFYPCPQNQERMTKYMTRMGLPFTLDSIQKAYADLNGDGLLVKKPGPKPADTPAPAPRASGISTHRSSPQPVVDFAQKAKTMTKEQLLEAAGGYQY